MWAVDSDGKAVVYTGPRENAERVRDELLAAGPDTTLPNSTGPLEVLLEPAEAPPGVDAPG
jgi:hypothetical protein